MSGFQLPGMINSPYIGGLHELAEQYEEKFGILDITEKSRKSELVRARKHFAYDAYHNQGYKEREIAEFLGHADHSTVSHYLKKVEEELKIYADPVV